MSRKVTFQPEAKAEIADAHAHYEAVQRGLGRRFRAAVRDRIALLKKSPLVHQIIHSPDVRRALVPGFPYAIIYRVAAGGIEVISIFHTSRNPAVWQQRTDDAGNGST
jgi:plasmid stabilization system protein ParE